jgi:hypothetical protein
VTPPIFIVCRDGALLVFASIERAEAALESPDVEAGEYDSAFDANGTRLAIEVTEPTRESRVLGNTSLTLTPVKLRAISDQGAAAAELRRHLASRSPDSSADLATLVEREASRHAKS